MISQIQSEFVDKLVFARRSVTEGSLTGSETEGSNVGNGAVHRASVKAFSSNDGRLVYSLRDHKDKGKKIMAKFIIPKLSFLFCSAL